MKKMAVVLILGIVLMATAYAANIESYLDINGAYMISNIDISYNGDTASMRATSAFVELAGTSYFGHFGITYRFKFGKALTINDEEVESGFGFNQEAGISFITEISDKTDFVANLTYCWIKEEETGSVPVKDGSYIYYESYKITARTGELHAAIEAKYHMASSLVFNAGVEFCFPLFFRQTASGYYYGTVEYDISGIRVVPYAGLGFKIQ